MMSLYHNIQERYSAEQIESGKTFVFQNVEYTIGNPVPQTLHPGKLPVGVIMNGYTAQYDIMRNGICIGQACFYFYGSFEGDQWAVLDELMLSKSATA